MITFDLPQTPSSILKVIGVGGGGSNAVNYMHSLNMDGIEFVVCNTDAQALAQSNVPHKVQLGPHLTEGLGAGANPEVGAKATEESIDEISKILKVNTKMAFITAGMGGGTGTGGAPVIAKICRDLGILTVGIVTTPFTYEGRRRMKQAQEGIDRLREHVDTIVVVSNDKLRQQFGNLPFTQAFAKADDVLATASKCITDVITSTKMMNTDFADVRTVMSNGGVAILGNASEAGENRAQLAAEAALNSPLLNDNDIRGARWILLNVVSAPGEHEHNLDELDVIQAYVQQQAGDDCDVILGMGYDENLGDKLSVTVIATGFGFREIKADIMEKKDDRQKFVLATPGQENKTEAAPAKPAAPAEDPMMPRLITDRPAPAPAPNPSSPVDNFMEQIRKRHGQSPITPTPERAPEPQPQPFTASVREESQPAPQAQQPFQPVQPQPAPRPAYRMSEEDAAEKERFEQAKRELEAKAERLRELSFGTRRQEQPNDVENVPAFLRQGRNLDDKSGQASKDESYLSGYSVGPETGNANGARSTIQTINTFLQGNKPD